MPTINQQQAGDPIVILSNYVQRDGWGINSNTETSTSFSFQDLTAPVTFGSMTVTGTDFLYLNYEGQLIPFSGTVESIKINPGFFLPGQPPYVPLEITGLGLSVQQLFAAAQSGESAVRTLFADLEWIWNGSSGNDSFTGGNLGDVLRGNDGNDVIRGGAGSDTIVGDNGLPANDGNDTLFGDAGNDFMYGYGGIDSISGGTGDDYMSGGSGGDFMNGNAGNDRLYGQAGSDTMFGENGTDRMDGGADADTMTGGAGSDSYYVDNVGDKAIEANVAGVDKVNSSVSYSIFGQFIENLTLTGTANINGAGNSLSNAVAGNAGNNTLSGLQGNDIINGLAGQDVIYGGVGNDTLIGGTGPDRFVFDTAPNATTNRDTITDFNVVDDNIWLDNSVFTTLGPNGLLAAGAFHNGTGAHDANDRIIYNSASGALFYDSNGSAAGGSVQFATLSTGLAMTNADFLII